MHEVAIGTVRLTTVDTLADEYFRDRQRLVARFQFLEADDIGLLLGQVLEEARQPRLDAVDVVGDDPHAPPLTGADQIAKLEPQPQPDAGRQLAEEAVIGFRQRHMREVRRQDAR